MSIIERHEGDMGVLLRKPQYVRVEVDDGTVDASFPWELIFGIGSRLWRSMVNGGNSVTGRAVGVTLRENQHCSFCSKDSC